MRAKRIESSRTRHRQYRKERGFFGQRRPAEDDDKKKDEKTKPKRKLRHYIRRYIGVLGEFRGYVGILVVLGLFSMVFRAVLPWTSKFMIDTVLSKNDLALLFGTCAVLLVIAVADIVVASITDYTSRLLSSKMQVHMRRLLISHLQVMPLDRLEKLKTGGIISRLEGDVGSFSDLLYEGFLTPLSGILMFVIAIGSLVLISPMVTMICCGFCLVLFCIAYLVFNVMRPLFRDIREDVAKISGRLAETFGGIRVVRCFGRENYESREFVTSHHLVLRKNLHTAGLNIAVHRSVWFIHWCMNIAIWGTAGYFVIHDHRLTIGGVVVFVQFSHWFFQPVFMIMHSLSHMQNSIACTERIFDLLDEEVVIKDDPDAVAVEGVRESLRFESVSFSYESEKPVLQALSFEVPAGQTVALVGPSGAGKTTVTNLLVRFYDPEEGQITLDGRDVRHFRLREYRGLFSLVLQDVFLFDGTVAENIAYSYPEATREEIVESAKAACADEFIREFPEGYDTVIGERGVKLSGGQKQRISLARAILRDPEVLILDEATSSLDSESEALIQEALRTILAGRTTLVIAHRLSTIMDADKIVVLVDGVVAEEGTHDELLTKRGKYYEMFTKQMEKAHGKVAFLAWDNETEDGQDGEGDQ
jgi:ATP-binding cassette subfamily B protein/subfamily B ATP-binding cassette protein MsbA